MQSTSPAIAVSLAIQGEYDRHGNWTKLIMVRRAPVGQNQQQLPPQVFTQEIEYY